MKIKYTGVGKFNYQGNQYRTGDILTVDSLGELPENLFEVIEDIEASETKKKKTKTKEVKTEYGDNEDVD